MSKRRGKGGWVTWTLLALAILALVLFGVWRWAVAQGSAGLLDWIDARYPRSEQVRLAEAGRYGPDAAQKVELWVPAAKRPAPYPLVVFIHGGGWHSGRPQDYRFVARTLGEHGYATALVGYRLVPKSRFPAMLEDSARGVRWALDHAAAAGARGNRTVLMGHSAGAYNVLMLGLDPQWLAAAGVPRNAVTGVVSLAGPADFYPFTSDSARNALGNAPEPRLTQPITFARADAPPILLLHGTADTVVRPRNSRNLAAAIAAKGGVVRETEFPGMSHAGIVMGLSRPFAQGGKVLGPILAFLREHADGAAAPASVPVQRESR
ncbi:MAG: alpha/beta hydrolase [Tsuneonella sp.]